MAKGRDPKRAITFNASGELLKEGALDNDERHQLAGDTHTGFPRGVYRYPTLEAADAHWRDCQAARRARNIKSKYTETELREFRLRNAIANVELEGVRVGEEGKVLARQVIGGEISAEEAVAQIRAKYSKQPAK